MTRLLPSLLLLTCAGLIALIALEIQGAWRVDSAAPAAIAAAALPPTAKTEPVDAAGQHQVWLREILARPLFSPSRRPVETGVRGLPRLAGIVVTGDQKLAIFAAPNGGHPVVAEAGAHVGAYVVRDVADDGVTVAGPGGVSTIRPTFDPARPVPPPPVRPPVI